MAVEPASLTVVACARTGDRSAAAWQQVLQPWTWLEFVVSDAAKGIAGGVQAVAAARAESCDALALQHGLDVLHTAQEAQRVLAGPWRRAEAAWEEAEAADAEVAKDRRQGRDARGAAARAWRAWERAEQALAAVDRQEAAWQRAQAALAVFQPDGRLNERAAAELELAAVVAELSGPEGKKVRNFLTDPRCLAFLDRLHVRLATAEPDADQRQAWVRRWWLRHRHEAAAAAAASVIEQGQRLVEAVVRERLLCEAEQQGYDRVAAVLRTTVRASSAVEGINSVLRMQQCRHRRMTQGLLDLKRLYWNCRQLPTGKRRQRCPYELLGVSLPTYDFWELLHWPPGELAQLLSTSKVRP